MDRGSGKAGEEYVCRLLKRRGYRILVQNYRCRFGEIDIIAEKRPYIVFVEVKTREKGSLASPWEAVTPEKQRKIIRTAEWYLSSHPIQLQPRFDVAAVETENGRMTGTEFLENAFLT